MKMDLYTDVSITRDLPTCDLRAGDLVKLVDHLTAADGSPGYAVEVFNALGETVDVHFVPANAVAPLQENEILCVRPLGAAA